MRRGRTLATMLVAGACLLGSGNTASAQESPNPSRIWVGLGFVVGVGGAVDEGLGVISQMTYQKRPHSFTLRWFGLWEVNFPAPNGDSLSEFSLLYGRTGISSWGHASLSTGLSYVSFDPCRERETTRCGTMGVPIVAEAAVQSGVVGIGFQASMTLNREAVFWGGSLFVQLGWMP